MNDKLREPTEYDLVLGGDNPPPVDGLVLGGIAGVERRLFSQQFATKLDAVTEALKYDDEGIGLVIYALQKSSEEFRHAAARILKQQGNLDAKQALLDYNTYLFFTTLKDWKSQKAYPEVKIHNHKNAAYIIECKKAIKIRARRNSKKHFRIEGLSNLLENRQVDKLEALIFKIDCEDNQAFKICTKAICDANEQFLNLKALFIGDSEENMFRKSYLNIFDIRPILEAYPNLEVLQVRGCFCGYPLECEDSQHKNLKTLIIETADISDRNLSQICNLDLPALEYLEIWLGRQVRDEVKSLDRILNEDPFPWLKYLGLKSGEQSDRIAQAIVNSPVLKHLYVLDLSLGTLTDTGVEALLNCPEIEQLDTLDISYNAVSEGAIACLSALDINLIANNQANDPYYGHRYSTLHE